MEGQRPVAQSPLPWPSPCIVCQWPSHCAHVLRAIRRFLKKLGSWAPSLPGSPAVTTLIQWTQIPPPTLTPSFNQLRSAFLWSGWNHQPLAGRETGQGEKPSAQSCIQGPPNFVRQNTSPVGCSAYNKKVPSSTLVWAGAGAGGKAVF